MVQYKSMEREDDDPERTAVYRPDARFDAELARMIGFRRAFADRWTPTDGVSAYRLHGDGFFFKFCSRIQLEVLSEALLPGMYLSREHIESLLADPASLGPRGGRQITFENCGRHLSNTLFADLVRDGWIGTRSVSSARVAQLVQEGLAGSRSIVIARARRSGQPANVEETITSLGL